MMSSSSSSSGAADALSVGWRQSDLICLKQQNNEHE